MYNYENIINCLLSQYDVLKVPNRVILGIEIIKIIKAYRRNRFTSLVEYDVMNERLLFMGLPITIDYENKWIMMICTGKEWDGRNFLST